LGAEHLVARNDPPVADPLGNELVVADHVLHADARHAKCLGGFSNGESLD
jgi:hypothetical protein